MTEPTTSSLVIDRASDASRRITTPWSEHIHFRVRGAESSDSVIIADYTCPVDFGPARHIHFAADEILEMRAGQIVVWLPDQTFVLGEGDTVSLPRGIPHAWRSCGEVPPRMIVTSTNGDLEKWFEEVVRRRLPPDAFEEFVQVGKKYRVELNGPPLSDQEVAGIVAAAERRKESGNAVKD
ncbi:MAG: cupin domain-containing protein [Rhodospirillales bacterium]|nr:cupin domain-containing protein [Acetobacter sp.]